ncbi:MAG: hypothetical protein M0R06_16830 [Sphaerochaeta sp.]|nr:hypothetical protein [Sphaerochaeta sp.]
MIKWRVSEAGVLVLLDDKTGGDMTQICFSSIEELCAFARDLNAGALAVANKKAEKERGNVFRQVFPKMYDGA